MKYLCLVYLDEKRLDEVADSECKLAATRFEKAGTPSPRRLSNP